MSSVADFCRRVLLLMEERETERERGVNVMVVLEGSVGNIRKG